MIFLSNSVAFEFLFALIIQESFQLSSKVKTWPLSDSLEVMRPIGVLLVCPHSSGTCVGNEVLTFFQRKIKVWCIALKKLTATSGPQRTGMGLVTFL